MKYLFSFTFLLLGLILAGCRSNINNNFKDVIIGGQKFNLEIARTEQQRETGLMNRKTLPKDSGMLFLFDQKSVQTFWMKNTLIPLQIIFTNDCKIVDIQEMVVEKDPSNPIKHYTSQLPADKAIELNSESVPTDLRQTIQELCH